MSDISATLARIHTFVGTMSADVPPPPVVPIGPWGAGEGELKLKKMGVVSFVQRTATISISLSDAKCSPVCRAQTCAHSGVEPSRSAKAFLQGGPKTSKKFRIFHHFETLVHISQKLLKIEAYIQRSEKSLISPLSNCRMCLDPSVTWFCRVGQK